MILPDFKDFPRSGRLVGVDWGAKRTGIAVSDETRNFIFTRPVITLNKAEVSMAKKIAAIAKAEKAVGIVFGLPLYADGTESKTTALVRLCATETCTYTDLPIVFIEENFTSITAQENMVKVRLSDIKQRLDSESAKVILENAISVLNRL